MILDSLVQRLEMKSEVRVQIDPESAQTQPDSADSSDKKAAEASGKSGMKEKKDKPALSDEERAARKAARKAAKAAAAGEETAVVQKKRGAKSDSKSGAESFATNPIAGDLVGDAPVEITGDWAEYTGKDHRILLRGSARIAEPDRSLSAKTITAFLTPENKIEHVEARGDSVLESKRGDKPAKLQAVNMNFFFDKEGSMTKAEARKDSLLTSNSADMPSRLQSADMDFFFDEEGNLTRTEARDKALAAALGEGAERELSADKLELFAKPGAAGSEIDRIKATGNVLLKAAAPAPTQAVPNPLSKELTADEADVFYYPGGKFMREAHARGNAAVVAVPLERAAGAERKTLRAQRCTLFFYETDNAAKEMKAEGGVKIEAIPYEPDGNKPARVTESERAHAVFNKTTGDIASALQEGDFKYQEGVRRAISDKANYDGAKSLIELRGGKAAVWDDASRTQADEIDIYTVKQESIARGRVRSTYYNPGTAGQAAPFRNMQSPVFITAKEAHSYNARGEAVYTGDARTWQDDNFVKADRLELYRDGGRMTAIGNVSSALYQKNSSGNAPRGRAKTVPVFATSDKMTYSDKDRIAEYIGTVKMKQGVEKLDAERVKIFLQEQDNEIDRMEAFEHVVLIQPGRRAEGDKAEYTASEDRTVIIGNSARVFSEQQGTVTGRRLTLLGGDDKIFADDQRGAKRVKSTHEVQR